MKNWKELCLVVLCATALGTACDKNQKTAAPAADEENAATQTTLTAEEVEKTLVDGCEGSGTLAAAKAAFTGNDFKEANRQARCVFNDSVKADPNKPNTEAAFIAFLSSLALVVESPQFVYVTDITVAANTVFGTAGDPHTLSSQLDAKFTGSGIAWFKNFFKFHEDKGHSVNDVAGKVFEFFTENFDDWHVLLKAMATDPKFTTAKIPANFAGNSTDDPFTFTEAAYFLIWTDGLRFAGKFLSYYDLGITNSNSFTDNVSLVTDLNTAPRFLSLKGDANGSAAAPYADLVLSALALGAGNYHTRTPEAWLAGSSVFSAVVPTSAEGQAQVGILVAQLKDSLQGHTVFLSASDLKFGIDLKKMFASLPNSASVNEVPFKVDGGGLDFREEWLKEIVKPFAVVRE